jgi:pimeloyl-ACP methyl ester carboxylesterase
MIHDSFILHSSNQLHYAKTGNGEKHLLVFHGFGQDMSVFDFLARSLARHYTFYVFDLYFHGRSTWAHDEKPISKKEWKETIELFLHEHHISRFSVAGFSLGGKFALATLEAFPEKTENIFLIAPDGIKTSFWYSLATYPHVFRKFFKSMIFHPERFLSLAKGLNKSGLVDNGLLRFAEYQMNSEEKRKRVYYSWVVFRHLRFDLNHIAHLINSNAIRLTIVTGRYDRVIAPGNMKGFLKKVKQCRFEILESGHSGLINQSLPYFTEVPQ